jgi:hypothetical protein
VVNGLHITVQAIMEKDTDITPEEDGDWTTEADREAWRSDEWEYVSFLVAVEVNHTAIGFGSTCGVVHGTLGEDPDRDGVVNEVDAWENTPAEYGHRDGRDWVSMGSALNGCIVEAIDSAEEWLHSIGLAEVSLLADVRKWADPNKPATKRRP